MFKNHYTEINKIITKVLNNKFNYNKLSLRTEHIFQFLNEGALITFINPYSMSLLMDYDDINENFDYFFIDGLSLVKLIEYKTGKSLSRISFDMTSMAKQFFKLVNETSLSIFFIGAFKKEITSAVDNILKCFPNLNIVGVSTGYFDLEEEIISGILRQAPDIVIVGMGTPKQELLLIKLRKIGWHGIGITCGGFLKQAARKLNYYPQKFDDYQLRWLYRIFREPRLLKRYFWDYTKQILRIFFLYKKKNI